MPAPRLALVTCAFHPADVAFIQGWSARVPGIGGWRVALDHPAEPERIEITPPGATAPLFRLLRDEPETVVWRLDPGGAAELGRFPTPRAAVQALCALHPDDLEALNESMEQTFPRRR
jgi:hypothetical protein